MPDLSELAWAILDRISWGGAKVDFYKVAEGQRDALIKAGAAVKVMTQPAGKQSFRHRGTPARFDLVITDLGRKLLADRRAAAGAAESR